MDVRPARFTPEQIQRRILAVMANEGARVLAEGISLRPSDIDLVFVNGYGFPRLKGGPMFAADQRASPPCSRMWRRRRVPAARVRNRRHCLSNSPATEAPSPRGRQVRQGNRSGATRNGGGAFQSGRTKP